MRSRAIIFASSLVFTSCASSGNGADGGSAVEAASPLDRDASSVNDASQLVVEVTDAAVCQESLDAWCAMPTGCIGDWASAVHTVPDQGCWGWSVKVCGGYDVLSWQGTDGLADEYYDGTSGQLVAIVYGGTTRCLEGPPAFMPPLNCSPSTPLCDLLREAGADSTADALDSSSE